MSQVTEHAERAEAEDEGFGLLDLLILVAENLKLLILGPLVAGAMALGITFLIPPTYTAKAVILPPQQQQSTAAAALQSLGALAGLASVAGAVKSPADQYVALMQSTTALDRLVDQYKLMEVYDAKYRADARKELLENSRIVAGKKDGLISIEVDDKDPRRAAALANGYVEQLRRLTTELAITEAQQRRLFFEKQLQQASDRLKQAQSALQATGFTEGALRAEPRAAAETYARLKAQVTAAEVRLQSMHSYLTEGAPEFQQAKAAVNALRAQLARAEAADAEAASGEYISRYRDFKYYETLFELFAKQFELAKVDESREGALVQVVDTAAPPEKKSKPKRLVIVATAVVATVTLFFAWVLIRYTVRNVASRPEAVQKIERLRRPWAVGNE